MTACEGKAPVVGDAKICPKPNDLVSKTEELISNYTRKLETIQLQKKNIRSTEKDPSATEKAKGTLKDLKYLRTNISFAPSLSKNEIK